MIVQIDLDLDLDLDLDQSVADESPVESLTVFGVSDLEAHLGDGVRLMFPPGARIAELVVAGSIMNVISYEAGTEGLTLTSHLEECPGVALGVASRRFPAISQECQDTKRRVAPASDVPTRIYCLSTQSMTDDLPVVSLPASLAAHCTLAGDTAAYNRSPWPARTAYPASTLDEHPEVTANHTPTIAGDIPTDRQQGPTNPRYAIIESESPSESPALVISAQEFVTI